MLCAAIRIKDNSELIFEFTLYKCLENVYNKAHDTIALSRAPFTELSSLNIKKIYLIYYIHKRFSRKVEPTRN